MAYQDQFARWRPMYLVFPVVCPDTGQNDAMVMARSAIIESTAIINSMMDHGRPKRKR